ncbi:MAG: macrocin O-methyltransferase [Citrobacter freundii]|nr:MAG: macrocin O-methyltransferase [Citrobacter freundii]
MKKIVKKIFQSFDYDIVKTSKGDNFPGDFNDDHKRIIKLVEPFTMTSRARLFSLIEAVKYISKHNIEGDIVECGVWKGGSMLAVSEVLTSLKDTNRDLYLYDTFEGMSEPTEYDKTAENAKASTLMKEDENKEANEVWAYATLDTVKKTMAISSYNPERIHYVKGKVEDTIPQTLPEKIALLRLDTDWYESTHHELVHLFPLLATGGILIIDDYGYWQGAKKAVDEYFQGKEPRIFLSRVDDTARIAVKH